MLESSRQIHLIFFCGKKVGAKRSLKQQQRQQTNSNCETCGTETIEIQIIARDLNHHKKSP